jgi:nucleoid-associated protein YgaU
VAGNPAFARSYVLPEPNAPVGLEPSVRSVLPTRKEVFIVGDRLQDGEKLEVGQSLTSKNGAYKVILQDDGNLVLYSGDQAVWSTETNGQNVVRAEVQKDGNFVLYTPDKPVWHTDTKGAKDVRLILQDDRNLVLYGFDGPAWSSNTQTDEAPAPPAAETPPAVSDAEVVPAAAEQAAPAPEAEPAAPPPPPPPPPPAPRTYTVVSGDTLWAIAERFYGDGNKYPQIAQASGVANPDLIHPGQVLTIP